MEAANGFEDGVRIAAVFLKHYNQPMVWIVGAVW